MSLDVKIGINPISWMNDDMPELGKDTPIESALEEGSRIGYRGFELGGRFPKEPAALRAKLAPYALECVSGWWSGTLADPTRTVEQEIRDVESHRRLLAENGSKVMVYGEVSGSVQGQMDTPLSRRPRMADVEAWKRYADKLDRFGTHLLRRGVRLAYHHHMGAYCQAPEDVDTLMSLTGPDVGLLFDTGHATFAGGDPVAMLTKHVGRVCHVHCKDVRREVLARAQAEDWSFLRSVLAGVFTVPGDGMVDFGGVLGVLSTHGYQGWLVVEAEQDPAVAPAFKYASMGHAHLSELVRAEGGRIQERA